MNYNYVCRVQYKGAMNAGLSKVYLFKTGSFSNAEGLPLSRARNEADYVTNAWCSSIKRKNATTIDSLDYDRDGGYTVLYRATLEKLWDNTKEKLVTVSFLFYFGAEGYNDNQLKGRITGVTLKVDSNLVEFDINDAGYTVVTEDNCASLGLTTTNVTTFKFSKELGRRSIYANVPE